MPRRRCSRPPSTVACCTWMMTIVALLCLAVLPQLADAAWGFPSNTTSRSRSLSDDETVSQTPTEDFTMTESLTQSDTTSLTETVTFTPVLTETNSETLSLTETFSLSPTEGRSSITETLVATFTTSHSISEEGTATTTESESLTSTMTATDSHSKSATMTGSETDDTTQSLSGSASGESTQSDTESFSESTSFSPTDDHTMTLKTFTMSETLSPTASLPIAPTETVSASTTATLSLSMSATPTQTITDSVTDDHTQTYSAGSASSTDDVTVSKSPTDTVSTSASETDDVTASSSHSITTTMSASDDPPTPTLSATRSKNTVTESFPTPSSTWPTPSLTMSASISVSMTDQLTKASLTISATEHETASLSRNASRSQTVTASLSRESVSATDDATDSVSLSTSDSVSTSLSAEATTSISASPSDERTLTMSKNTPSKVRTPSNSRSARTPTTTHSLTDDSTESKSITVSLTSEQTSSRSLTESGGTRSPSRSPPPTPTPTRSTSFSETVSEIGSFSDTITPPPTPSPSPSAESTSSVSQSREETLSDSVSESDETTDSASESESVTISDNSPSRDLTLTESVSGETPSGSFSETRDMTISESESQSDERSSGTESATTTNSLPESVTRETGTITASETLTLSAEPTPTISISRSDEKTITDSVSFSATVSRSRGTDDQTATESLSGSESVEDTGSFTTSHSASETVTEEETASGSRSGGTHSGSDTVTDDGSSSDTVTETMSDAVTDSPDVTPSRLVTDSISQETFTISSSSSATTTATASASDSESVSPGTQSMSTTEDASVSESLTNSEPSQTASDAVTLTEPSLTLSEPTETISDGTVTSSASPTVTEDASMSWTRSEEHTSSISTTHTLSAESTLTLSPSLTAATDEETLSESLTPTIRTPSLSEERTVSETRETFTPSAPLTDTRVITKTPPKSISDSLSTTFSLSPEAASGTETSTVSESASGPTGTEDGTATRTGSISISVSSSDTITGSDSVTWDDTASYSGSESVSTSGSETQSAATISDEGTASVSFSLSTSATLSVEDTSTGTTSPSQTGATVSLSPSEDESPTMTLAVTQTLSVTGSLSDEETQTESRTLTLIATFSSTTTASLSDEATKSDSQTKSLSESGETATDEGTATASFATESLSGPTKTHPSITYTGSADVTLTVTQSPSRYTPSFSDDPTQTNTLVLTETPSVSESDQPTMTNTLALTETHTASNTPPSPTETHVASETFSHTAGETLSMSPTLTLTWSRTRPSRTLTGDETETSSLTPTSSGTLVETRSSSISDDATPTQSLTPSDTLLPPETRTASTTSQLTWSFSHSESEQLTPTLTVALTPTRTLVATDTFSITDDPTMTLDTLSESPTQSLTDSMTVPLTETDSIEPTDTETLPPTPTQTNSTTATITPPPTMSRSATISVSATEQATKSVTISISMSPSRNTPSVTNEFTSTESFSLTTSASHSRTYSMTLSESVSASIEIFTGESDYVTVPQSPFDVLSVKATQAIRFINSPQYRRGDMAGIVPAEQPCTQQNALGETVAHPSMIAMGFRGPHLPSNWTVFVNEIGYYRVCYYMTFPVERWFEVRPQRRIAFGTRILSQIAEPSAGLVAGDVTFPLPVAGATLGDVVHLVPAGSPCAAITRGAIFLAVTAVFERVAVVGGRVPGAGTYTMCYRGWPQSLRSSQVIAPRLHFVGVATAYVATSPRPFRETQQLSVTLNGAGLSVSDLVFLSDAPTCFINNGTVIRSRPPTSSVGRRGLTSLNLVFHLANSGVMYMCYRSNSSMAGGGAVNIGEPLRIERITVFGVLPVNETYAVNSSVELTFVGELLEPRYDSAELHFNTSGCDDARPTRLFFDGSVWVAQVTRVGTYSICYATNTSTRMVLVPGFGVNVVTRFYEEPAGADRFFFGAALGDIVSFDIRGWGLAPVNDSTWLQYASLPCARQRDAAAIMPSAVVGRRVSFTITTIAGYLRQCYVTRRGNVLIAADVLPVQPDPPTAFTPIVGGVEQPVLITLRGGASWNLERGDNVVVCSGNASASAVRVTSPSTFIFVAPVVGQYQFCFRSGAKIHGGALVVETRIATVYSAVPIITSSRVLPQVAPVGTLVAVDVELFGFTDSDALYTCTPENGIINGTGVFTRLTPRNWTMRLTSVGNFSICFVSGSASSTSAYTLLPLNFTSEPAVELLYPHRIYSGDDEVVAYSGLNITRVSSFFVGGRDCSETRLPGAVRWLSATELAVRLVDRGDYLLCYRGISGRGFPVFQRLEVVPKVINMTLVTPMEAYTGCPAPFLVNGSGINVTLDRLYLSDTRLCSRVVAQLDVDTVLSTHSRIVGTVILPSAGVSYSLCFAPSARLSDAEAFGIAFAREAFDYSETPTSYTLRYRCRRGNATSFTFFLKTRDGGEWIQLDDPLAASEITMRHLPAKFAHFRVDAAAAPGAGGAVLRSETVVAPSVPAQFCANLPTNYTGSRFRRFAEAYFVVLNHGSSNCKLLATAMSPITAVAAVRDALLLDPTLLVDPVQMLPAIAAAVAAVPDPIVVGISVLDATLPNIEPYSVHPQPTLLAHLSAAADFISLSSSPSPTATIVQKQQLVLKGLQRITSVATSMCAGGVSSTIDRSVFSLSVQRHPPGTSVGQIAAGAGGSATVSMAFPSATGYCFTSIVMPTNLLSQPNMEAGRIRSRNFRVQQQDLDAAAATSLNFNMPLFSIGGDPLSTALPTPRLRDVVISYTYPASQQPTVPSTATAEMYLFNAGSMTWVQDPTATLTFDQAARTVRVNISSSNANVALISGALTFTPSSTTAAEGSRGVDILVLAMGGAIVLLSAVALGLTHRSDRIRDKSVTPDLARILSSMDDFAAGHRYLAPLRRFAHHPITTPARLAPIIAFAAAAFVATVVIAHSGQEPRTRLLGAAIGALATAMATPFAVAVRVLLFAQPGDWPALLASVCAIVALVVVAPASSSFMTGAIVCAAVGAASFAIFVLAFRRRWTRHVDVEASGVARRLFGWVLVVLLLVAVAACAAIFGLVDLLPQDARTAFVALTAWLWAVAMDVLLVEPLTSAAVPMILARLQRRYGAAQRAPGARAAAPTLKSLPYEVEITTEDFDDVSGRSTSPRRSRRKQSQPQQRRFAAYDDDRESDVAVDEVSNSGSEDRFSEVASSAFVDELADSASVAPTDALSEAALSIYDDDNDDFEDLPEAATGEPGAFDDALSEVASTAASALSEARDPFAIPRNSRSRSNAGGDRMINESYAVTVEEDIDGDAEDRQANPLESLPRRRRVMQWY